VANAALRHAPLCCFVRVLLLGTATCACNHHTWVMMSINVCAVLAGGAARRGAQPTLASVRGASVGTAWRVQPWHKCNQTGLGGRGSQVGDVPPTPQPNATSLHLVKTGKRRDVAPPV
jgi:hypothetical protein